MMRSSSARSIDLETARYSNGGGLEMKFGGPEQRPVGTARSNGCDASSVSKPRELLVDPDRVEARNHFSQFAFTVSSIHF
jgi:hypothetical protein